MDLDPDIYERLKAIKWFARCGERLSDEFDFAVQAVPSLAEAMTGIQSDQWEDARTEAQGELTGYLASNHNDLYGGHWNRLAKASRQRIQIEIMPAVSNALVQMAAEQMSDSVLLDLNRIALHASYRKHCRAVPSFFGRLLSIYAAGRLPCGWDGDFDSWPGGKIVVY